MKHIAAIATLACFIIGATLMTMKAYAVDNQFSAVVISSYSPTKVLSAVYGTRSAKVYAPIAAGTTIYFGTEEVRPDVVYTSTYTYFTKSIPDSFVTWTSTYQYTTLRLPAVGDYFDASLGVTVTNPGSTWMQLPGGVSTMSVRVIDTQR